MTVLYIAAAVKLLALQKLLLPESDEVYNKLRNTKARKAAFKRFISLFVFNEYHAEDVTILYK